MSQEVAREGSASRPIKLFLVDDHPLIRRGLADAMDAEDGLQVVGEAGSGAEALERIEPAGPDLVILDVRLPDMSGIDVCREIKARHPNIGVIMLTSFTDESERLGSLDGGADGFVLKQTSADGIVDAIRRRAEGHELMDSATRAALARRRIASAAENPIGRLTPQERRVLSLIGEGMTNREIARSMGLSERTVKNYVSNVFAKLDLRHRTEAALFAARHTGEL
jgi:DNA-binding NarL/FixJ family response regulator